MTFRVRRLSILFLLTCALAATGQSPAIQAAPAVVHSSPAALGPVADLPPLVRLRKMHLARPDLIPYPIYIEVFC